MKKLNLAIIGQGRSGRQIHGEFYLSPKNKYFNVRYVVDIDKNRRKEALIDFKGCDVLFSYEDLYNKNDIDLVVNATYSKDHYPVTKDLLNHGFNVLCEKPFCANKKECLELINIAKRKNLVLAVFQQTFFAPFYQHALKVIKSKKLGDLLQVNIQYSGFSRRWDWQTLQKMLGGNSYNTGPHPFGIALGILDFDSKTKIIYSKLSHTEMSQGDYDDFVKVLLTAPNKPIIDVEVNSNDAYSNFNIKIIGSRGTMKSNTASYEMKYIVPGENKKIIPSSKTLLGGDGKPIYCSEKLKYHEEKGNYNGTAFDVGTELLYKNVYDSITKGKTLYVTSEKASRITDLIDTIHKSNPISKKF